MKSVVRSVLEPRPPSRPKTIEPDVTRAFASLEDDILGMQNFVERLKVKNLDSGIHRGRLQSRRSLRSSSTKPQNSGVETSMTLQNYRNSTLTEPIYNLIISTLGSQYSAVPSDTILRLSLLKIKLYEVFLKKVSEILAVRLEADPENDGKLISLLFKLIELNPEPKENDSRIRELEQTITDLKKEKKEKSLKESEEETLRLKNFEKNKNEELENALKKIKELEVDKGRVSLLAGELEKLRKKLAEAEFNEARVSFLQSELENSNTKLADLAESFEKGVRETKKLRESVEKYKIQEKSSQVLVDGLNKEVIEMRVKAAGAEALFEEKKRKEVEEVKRTFEEKIRGILKENDEKIDKAAKDLAEVEDRLKQENEDLRNFMAKTDKENKKLVQDLNGNNCDLSLEINRMRGELEKSVAENTSIKVSLGIVNSENLELKEKSDKTELENRKKTKELEERGKEIEELNEKLKNFACKEETEKFLYSEIYKMRAELTQVSWKLDERLILCEKLESEVKNLKSDLAKARSMCDRMQNELAKKSSDFDEDTFENVMRNEMNMMRDAYEKRIKDYKDEIDNIKRKNMLDNKKVKDELKAAEHSREYLEIRLKALSSV